jgi:hypothetical protein
MAVASRLSKPFGWRRSVARQSGWERGDDQEGHFDGRGEMMIVAARR